MHRKRRIDHGPRSRLGTSQPKICERGPLPFMDGCEHSGAILAEAVNCARPVNTVLTDLPDSTRPYPAKEAS